MRLDPRKIKRYSTDPALFKLAMAEQFLKKIPKRMPKSESKRILLEADLNSFLFFSSSVIDVIKREINNEFEIFDKDNVFYIHGIRKHLADSGKQKKIKKLIASYFTTPSKKNSIWDMRHSSLWRLQILRNKVTHGHILKSKDQDALYITYVVPQYRKLGDSVFEIEEITKNPYSYFAQIFCDLSVFVKNVRSVILSKHEVVKKRRRQTLNRRRN